MDTAQKVGLVLDVITMAQDWRDRAIVASVIGKYPIETRDKWALAENIAQKLATCKTVGDWRDVMLWKQEEITGAELWALGWLAEVGIVDASLYQFDWQEFAVKFRDMIDHDMGRRRSEMEEMGRVKAIQDMARSYNSYVGGEAFTPMNLFKVITTATSNSERTLDMVPETANGGTVSGSRAASESGNPDDSSASPANEE